MILKTIQNKTEQVIRIAFVNTYTRLNNSVLLVEYPKSGGTWLGQLISSYLEIPFPRNRIPGLKKSLYHSHYLPNNRLLKNKKIVFLVRDGRDVMVSLYHHWLLWNEKNKLNPKDVNYHRSKVPFDDFENVRVNMGSFIKYVFENKPSKIKHFTYMGNWYVYNKNWMEKMKTHDNIYLLKYEDLLEKPYETMESLFKDFFKVKIDTNKLNDIINEFSFENQAQRKKGVENRNSFLRKGIRGDWKNYFGPSENELFKKYTKDLLVELNYEVNRSL